MTASSTIWMALDLLQSPSGIKQLRSAPLPGTYHLFSVSRLVTRRFQERRPPPRDAQRSQFARPPHSTSSKSCFTPTLTTIAYSVPAQKQARQNFGATWRCSFAGFTPISKTVAIDPSLRRASRGHGMSLRRRIDARHTTYRGDARWKRNRRPKKYGAPNIQTRLSHLAIAVWLTIEDAARPRCATKAF